MMGKLIQKLSGKADQSNRPKDGQKRLLIVPHANGVCRIIQQEYRDSGWFTFWISIQDVIGIVENSNDIQWYKERMDWYD